MKKFTTIFIAVLCAISVFAQKSFNTAFEKPTEGVYDVDFSLNYWDLQEKTIDGVTYQYIDMNVSTVTQQTGWAELPIISATVQLPNLKNVDFEIIYTDFTEISLDYPMLPSRGVIYRDQDPSTIPYIIDPESQVDSFYPAEYTKMEEPFIFRDVRGTSVRLTPFQYNAATNTLRVYNSVKVRMTENNNAPSNPLFSNHINNIKEVEGIYENMFINYQTSTLRANASLTMDEYGDILVITTSTYEASMAPYIQWKKEKGYNVSTQVVSAGTNVETTIQNAYNNNPNLMFVQLVGDWADIKSPTIYKDGVNCPVDPYMGTVSGTDDHIDISIGRFSCTSTSDLTTQINKTIEYEKNPDMTTGWRETFIGVASNEGSGIGDDSEIDYTHVQRIYNNRLDGFTYSTHNQNYAPSASASTLFGHINSGASTIAYCGHGDVDMFVTTGFDNSDISSLSNGNKLPFIVSVACVNGAFHNTSPCFAETWLRKSGGGAVVTWMSTINQPWQPPQRGQDYFYDILVGGFNYDTDGISNTTGYNTTEQRTHWGSIVVNSSVLMLTESSASDDIETIKTWTTFGDASLQLRTETPNALTLSNTDPEVGVPFEGTAYIDGSPAENVLICISADDNYYSGLTNGSGAYSITHSLSAGEALLVATAFNTTTVHETTTVIDADPCASINNFVAISTDDDVSLTWEVPADGNVTGYNIYQDGSLITTVTSLSYTHTSQANGTYEYCINAIFDGVECYNDECATVVVNDGSNSSCESPLNLSINEVDPTTHTLSWVAPAGSENIFDDIEGHTAFTINSAGNVPWTFIDGDATTTYSISEYTFTNQSLEMATIVFDPTLVTNTNDGTPLTATTNGDPFTAYSGNQFFATFNATSSTQTNDWIISPELNFAAPFEFTFQARSGHKVAFPEAFEVLYSTTTNDESAFTNVLETVSSAPFAWTEYSYTVPANAKYVAINCNSNDMYYFCVDDIYIGDGSAPTAALTGYNVYCDGIFLETTTETSFTNIDADTDYHEYCIEATYADNCISPQICETIGAASVTYEIVATAGTNGTISPAGTTTVNQGQGQVYTITPASCYEVSDVLVNGSSVGAVESYTFSNVTSNQTIYATFTQTFYAVSSTAGTGGNITAASLVNCGNNFTFTVDANACYEIETVSVNGSPVTLSGNSYTVNNVTSDLIIDATFTELVYNVTENAGTGGIISTSASVNCGDDLTFIVDADACYEVGTVTVNGTPVTLSGNSYTIHNVTEDIEINASFDAIIYNITETTGTNGSITVANTVNCGDDLVITFIPNECYEVASCNINGTPITPVGNSYTVINVSEDIDIEASFSIAASYDIITNTSTGGSIDLTSQSVACGGEVTLTVTPEPCYVIGEVTVNGTPVTLVGDSYTITNITTETTINAEFNQIVYNVTTNAEAGGIIVAPSTADCGNNLEIIVDADACYEIGIVTVNGTPVTLSGNNYTINDVNEDINIEATFTLLSYTITANVGTGGSITPNGETTVDCGTNQTFTITPDVNYIINDVLVDGLSVGALTEYTFSNITDDATIIATFIQSTGIFSNNNSEITVYPNPADNFITIELDFNETEAQIINILSIDGKLIRNINITSDETTIDISSLSSGIYFINIASKNESLQVVKLIRL